MHIDIINQPTAEQLKALNVNQWPIWEKEVSSFPWTYDMEEVCYILEGKVTVTVADTNQAVELSAGQLVSFPKGMVCHWDISQAIRKHYQFR